MRRTKGDPIQFRLLVEDMDILERLADEAGVSPKEYVIDLTMAHIDQHRNDDERRHRVAGL